MIMATGTHSVEVPVSQQKVWDFVSDMEKWAKLVPGYSGHEMISDTRSTWTFKGNVSVIKKTVEVQIDILEWNEPEKVTFQLTGLSDKFSGTGYFIAEPIDATHTKMTGHLDVKAEGLASAVLNPVLKPVLPKATQVLTDRVANALKRLHA